MRSIVTTFSMLAVIALPTACATKCEKDAAQYEQTLVARERDLGQLLGEASIVSIPVALGTETADENASLGRIVLTRSGLFGERISAAQAEWATSRDIFVTRCNLEGALPIPSPAPPQALSDAPSARAFIDESGNRPLLVVMENVEVRELERVLEMIAPFYQVEIAPEAEDETTGWSIYPLETRVITSEGTRQVILPTWPIEPWVAQQRALHGNLLRPPPNVHGLHALHRPEDAGPDFTITSSSEGLVISGSGGYLAPNCEHVVPSPETTIGLVDGHPNWRALGSCLPRLRRAVPYPQEVTVTVAARSSIADAVTLLALVHSAYFDGDYEGRAQLVVSERPVPPAVLPPIPPQVIGEETPRGNVEIGRTEQIGSGEFGLEHVTNAAQARSRAFRACYETALRENARLHGQVTVRFTIGSAGAVTSATVVENTSGAELLAHCVVSTVRRLRWNPGPPGDVTYQIPFVFYPQQ